MSETERTFKKVSEVLDFLIQQGYRFGKTKLYDDCTAKRLSRDGKIFTESAVLAYAKAYLKLDEKLDLKKIQAQRLLNKDRQEGARADLLELKIQQARGELVPTEDFEKALVGRAVALKQGFLNFAKSNAAQIIQITGGDRTRTPDLKVFLISAFENIFDDYAKNPVLEVPVAGRD